MMPIPRHLKGLVVPRDGRVDEGPLSADVRCPCGVSAFELLYPGPMQEHDGEVGPCTLEMGGRFFFVFRARCTTCRLEHLLLDADFHGWDGFICHDPVQAALPRPPLVPWECRACPGTAHTMVVHIQTEGRQDFIEQAGADFDGGRWPDAFGWFDLDVCCARCGKFSPGLVSYETM